MLHTHSNPLAVSSSHAHVSGCWLVYPVTHRHLQSSNMTKAKPQPRSYCDPAEAFGDRHAKDVRWVVPEDTYLLPQIRAAVVQHAFVASARDFKSAMGMTQERLAHFDGRMHAGDKWNARLNGRLWMTELDYAALYSILDGWTAPTAASIRDLLRAAENP